MVPENPRCRHWSLEDDEASGPHIDEVSLGPPRIPALSGCWDHEQAGRADPVPRLEIYTRDGGMEKEPRQSDLQGEIPG